MTRIILALLLLSSTCHALDTPSHGLQGGLMFGAVAQWSGASKTMVWVAFGTGAVLGALPDLMGATGVHRPNYWPVYTRWHSGTFAVSYLPPIALHLLIDKAFHPVQGKNWWPDMWKAAVAVWIVEAVLMYVFITWINK